VRAAREEVVSCLSCLLKGDGSVAVVQDAGRCCKPATAG
jgi:hypothetical protein